MQLLSITFSLINSHNASNLSSKQRLPCSKQQRSLQLRDWKLLYGGLGLFLYLRSSDFPEVNGWRCGEWRIRMDDHYRRWYWIRLSNQQSHQRARWHLASRCGSMRTDLCSNLSRWRAGCKWPQIRRQATIPGCKQQYAIVHWQYWSGAATPSVLCWLDDWDPNMERGQGRENNQGMRAGSERKRAGRLLAIWFWSSSRLFSNS